MGATQKKFFSSSAHIALYNRYKLKNIKTTDINPQGIRNFAVKWPLYPVLNSLEYHSKLRNKNMLTLLNIQIFEAPHLSTRVS